MSNTSLILLAIIGLLALYLIYSGLRVRNLLANSAHLVAISKPFEQNPPSATTTILVLGDSTAVGTGATPATSIAGRLGALYPTATVHNFGVNGQKLAGLDTQMDTLAVKDANIVLLQIGANDISYFTPLAQIDAKLQDVLRKAKNAAGPQGKVIIFHSGSVGEAPFFPVLFGWMWNIRTRQVREIYLKDTAAAGATYIDILKTNIDATFASDPDKYYASDMFHPSADGYALWFSEVQKVLAQK